MKGSASWIRQIASVTVALTVGAFAGGAARAEPPGPEVCKACHAPYVEAYEQTKHGQKGNVAGPTCVTCHGDASDHVAQGGGRGVGGIFGFNNKAIPADQKAAVCLGC